MTTDRDIVSLRDYIDERFRALDARMQEQWRAHELIHEQDRAQVRLASRIQDERLTHMNAFRDQINRERADYITRGEALWALGTAVVGAGIMGGIVTRFIVAFL